MALDLQILLATAAFLGWFHTVIGPDHYIPFIVMSRIGKWSKLKTFFVTLAAGLGHVGSSVVIGFIGIALGIAVTRLEAVESIRGSIAAWALIAFGLAYLIYGLRHAYKNKHGEAHDHSHGHFHIHPHDGAHDHPDSLLTNEKDRKKAMTPWVLITIFVFGPCEPLIPILMFPAATGNMLWVWFVVIVFGFCTLTTMITIVMGSYVGLKMLRFNKAERFSHAIAGATILICGLGMVFLGL